jgi:hypothetical protein
VSKEVLLVGTVDQLLRPGHSPGRRVDHADDQVA